MPDPAARGGHGAGGGAGPGRAPQHRVHAHLPAPDQRLAGRSVPAGRNADRCRPEGRDCHDRCPGSGRQMSAVPARARGADRAAAGTVAAAEWAQIERAAPALAATMRRYLAQAATFLAPRSVDAADGALRQLARWILASTSIESVTEIRRDDFEDFKVWLSGQNGIKGALSANTY